MDLQWLRDNYSYLANYAIDLCEINIINRMYELPPPWDIIRKKLEQFEYNQKTLHKTIERKEKKGQPINKIKLATHEDYYLIIKKICDNQVDPTNKN